jgi:hypothetical protein
MYLANIGLSYENEWKWDRYDVSFTDDFQLTLASHYDPETGVLVKRPRPTASLYMNDDGELIAAGGQAEPVVDHAELRRDALARLRDARSNVLVRFRAPLEIAASGEAWLSVEVVNDSPMPLTVGQNSRTPAKFSVRWRRGESYVSRWDDSSLCFADVPVGGGHEQIVRVDAPPSPGLYELEIQLVVDDAVIVAMPSAARVHVVPDGKPATDPESMLVESEPVRAAGGTAAPSSGGERLRWIRENVRARPILRTESPRSRDTLLAVAIECATPCAGAASTDVQLSAHFKKDGEYLAWDVQRHVLPGLRSGVQVRAVPFERPLDPAVEVEFGALVTGEGYVPLFRA